MGFLDDTLAGDIVSKIKSLVTSEISKKKKNDAFSEIEQLTGIPFDEKQRLAIQKSGVDPEQIVTQFKIKSLKEASEAPKAARIISDARQPGGFEKLQKEFPFGVKATEGGASIEIPSLMEQKIKSQKKEEEEASKAGVASKATFRFIQRFNRSLKELEAFDPGIGDEGIGGKLSRIQGKIAEKLDELPETKALLIQIKPLANGMAREIEGGRVTDQDRKIYADSFANALANPAKTNIRLLSDSIIDLIDKGGNQKGDITNQLKLLAESETDIFNSVIAQVLIEYPEMTKDIFGEDFELVGDENENKK